MESTAQFSLEQAVASWRANLSNSGYLSQEDIDELESHLVEETEQLSTLSLSHREAFIIAVDRIGSQEELKTSYTKSKSLWSIFKIRSVLYLQTVLVFFILTLLALIIEFPTAYILEYFVLPLDAGTYLYLGLLLSIVTATFFILRYLYGRSIKPENKISFTGYLTLTTTLLTLCSFGTVLYITSNTLPMEYFTVVVTRRYLSMAIFFVIVFVSLIYSIKDFKSYKLKTT